jgi:hypothetical protein
MLIQICCYFGRFRESIPEIFELITFVTCLCNFISSPMGYADGWRRRRVRHARRGDCLRHRVHRGLLRLRQNVRCSPSSRARHEQGDRHRGTGMHHCGNLGIRKRDNKLFGKHWSNQRHEGKFEICIVAINATSSTVVVIGMSAFDFA